MATETIRTFETRIQMDAIADQALHSCAELFAHVRHRLFADKDIIAYVQSTWSVTYSVPGMRNWLQRYGFSYKKPALVPGKANEQQQREWLAQYEKLKFGFFATLSTLDAESVLGQTFRSRVRDRFRLIGAPI
jgi:hypothetical protein